MKFQKLRPPTAWLVLIAFIVATFAFSLGGCGGDGTTDEAANIKLTGRNVEIYRQDVSGISCIVAVYPGHGLDMSCNWGP